MTLTWATRVCFGRMTRRNERENELHLAANPLRRFGSLTTRVFLESTCSIFIIVLRTTSARLFVGIGRGEVLPHKDTRHLLLKTWLQPLIDDYTWLQHGCKSFDPKIVDEGIGRTILTLPLEDQHIIMLGWLSSFLKAGDNCPNLQKVFEVWWRRTFVRPHNEQSNSQSLD
ncbi:putative BTB/POZ domain-containing protein [Helianthus anomalus]